MAFHILHGPKAPVSLIMLLSSIFLCRFKVQWHNLSRWFANVEIKVCLFSPKCQQLDRWSATEKMLLTEKERADQGSDHCISTQVGAI